MNYWIDFSELFLNMPLGLFSLSIDKCYPGQIYLLLTFSAALTVFNKYHMPSSCSFVAEMMQLYFILLPENASLACSVVAEEQR